MSRRVVGICEGLISDINMFLSSFICGYDACALIDFIRKKLALLGNVAGSELLDSSKVARFGISITGFSRISRFVEWIYVGLF